MMNSLYGLCCIVAAIVYLFRQQLRYLLEPVTLRIWLNRQPHTAYAAHWMQTLIPVLEAAHGRPVFLCAPGLGVYARYCMDSHALGRVWLEGLVRAMVATGTPSKNVHLCLYGPTPSYVASLFFTLTGQSGFSGGPGEFAKYHGPTSVIVFAWDPTSHVGNEYWINMLGTSGDAGMPSMTRLPAITNVDHATYPIHVKSSAPYEGGEVTFQLYEWNDGVASPLASSSWEKMDLTEALRTYMFHTAISRIEFKAKRHQKQVTVTLDPTSLVPPQWVVDWSGPTVTFSALPPDSSSNAVGVDRQINPPNECGTLLSPPQLHHPALKVFPHRPLACMGIGNCQDGLSEWVVWDNDSRERCSVLVPFDEWDAFAHQLSMPDADDIAILATCSIQYDNIAFYSAAHLRHDVGKIDPDYTGVYATIIGTPGIRLEHNSPLAHELLHVDRCTFRNAV